MSDELTPLPGAEPLPADPAAEPAAAPQAALEQASGEPASGEQADGEPSPAEPPKVFEAPKGFETKFRGLPLHLTAFKGPLDL
ncbi:MAG TPA: hypothetical protein VFM16_06880, partial [Holophagaceae bacterium]|nr:hypothetical protein [Holophagaceae bacterium]